MLELALLVALAASAQTPPASQPAAQSPSAPPTSRPPAQAPAAAPASRPTTITFKVLDRSGTPLSDAQITLDGPSSRQGTTKADGTVVVQNAPPGTYRAHIERTGYITLEKEIMVRSGTPATAEAALSAAPPPPPPPPAPAPPPPVAAPQPMRLPAGASRVVSLSDLAEHLLDGRDPVQTSVLGCSGGSTSKLMSVRDAIATHTNADADEMLYIVAGDGTLKLGDKDQAVGPSWFSIVPRGTSSSLTRRGRTPMIVLSIVSGSEPCEGSASATSAKK